MLKLRVVIPALIWAISGFGCAYLRPAADVRSVPSSVNDAWETRLSRLQSQRDWQIKGKISVQNADDGFTAGIQWKQAGERYEIELYDPLGRKSAIIRAGPGQAEIETSKGEYAKADNAESLMQQQLGWSAPLSSLHYWVLGIPDPESPIPRNAATLDAYGRLASLKQSDWSVNYPQYSDDPIFSLPERINASGQSLTIKLLIKDWNLTPGSAPE